MTVGASVAKKISKKAGGSETRRFGTLVRLAEDVVADAKVVASLKGMSMAEYLSETLRPIVKKALAEELRRRVNESEGGSSKR